jgi:hypothetical protein
MTIETTRRDQGGPPTVPWLQGRQCIEPSPLPGVRGARLDKGNHDQYACTDIDGTVRLRVDQAELPQATDQPSASASPPAWTQIT